MTDDPEPLGKMLEPEADRDDLQDAGDIERSDGSEFDRDPLPGVEVEVFPPAAG